jgi:general secretion pathway protein N
MTRRSYIIAVAVLLIVAFSIFMPLRTIVDGKQISARKVDGIIWDGSIRELSLSKVPIGDVNARLKFLPLLLGRAEIALSRGDAPFAPGISGSVTKRFGGVSIDRFNATLAIGAMFDPLPVEDIILQDFSARFTGGRCSEAGGAVRMTLTKAIPGLDLSNGLLAKPRCDRGQLLIPLLSQSATEHVDIRLSADGAYSVTILLEGENSQNADALALAGFRKGARGYQMIKRGRL